MASTTDAPVDLYIAAYDDPDAARGDWNTIKELAKNDTIKVDGLILVSRRADGKIHVDDDFHDPDRCQGVNRPPVPQLARPIGAPALYLAAGIERTIVIVP